MPIPAPHVFAATSHEGFAPIAFAVSCCIGPKSTQVEVPLPVTNPPIVPIRGDINGKKDPVAVTRNAAISVVIPAYPMIFAVASTLMIVTIVLTLFLTVFTNTFQSMAGEAPWMRPPITAEIMMMTPGVLIQVNVSLDSGFPA